MEGLLCCFYCLEETGHKVPASVLVTKRPGVVLGSCAQHAVRIEAAMEKRDAERDTKSTREATEPICSNT